MPSLLIAKTKLLARHLWLDADDAKRTIGAATLQHLASHVAASERLHSGEIRICVEAGLPTADLLRLDTKHNTLPLLIRQRALSVFANLRVWDTEHNNGVLIYLLIAEQAIEIVADRGLAQHVPQAEFERMTAGMAAQFRAKAYETGLVQAVDAVTGLLTANFGSTDVQPNQMPDTPVLQ